MVRLFEKNAGLQPGPLLISPVRKLGGSRKGIWSYLRVTQQFDRDFVGREALERMADNPRREKVTLVWNGEDVTRVFETFFQDGGTDTAKWIDLPLSNYATLQYDKVLKDGETAGLSTYTGYTYNQRAMLSLACVDVEHSEPGTEVTVVWGEEGGGTSKPTVERHVQTEIRATVAPAPIGEFARTAYREASNEAAE